MREISLIVHRADLLPAEHAAACIVGMQSLEEGVLMQLEQWGGVLAISGAIDKEQKPLLMASYNDDNCVRLFDLPSFQERGSLPQMRDSRAIAAVPGDILVAGDVHGTVKVWRWKAPRMAVA